MDSTQLKSAYQEYRLEIETRLKEFSQIKPEEYFHELIFCILTPQSKAEKCWKAVVELKKCELNQNAIQNCLKTKTRFYKNKTRYLLMMFENWPEIKEKINSEKDVLKLREYLVANVKGMGLKEASHFLRNIGKSNNQLAILDRHILRKLVDLKLIDKIPNLNNKTYFEIESKMKQFSAKTKIELDELDLLFWKIESGRIFK